MTSSPRARRAPQLDKLHEQLLHAGLAGSVRAEEVLAVNILTALTSTGMALLWILAAQPSGRLAVTGFGVAVAIGVLGRRVASRVV